MNWNDATEATLRQLWAEGHSTVEIARRMGCSKNTIIGKVYRLELPKRANASQYTPGSLAAAEAVNKRLAKVRARQAESVRDTIAMARAGRPTADIARELGAHLDTVRRWLREAGESRPMGYRQRPQRRGGRQPIVPRVQRQPSEARQPPTPRAPRPPRVVVPPAVPKAPHAAVRYGVTGCRWPHGEPGTASFRFCEDPAVVPGKPYCAACCARAYVQHVPAGGAFVLPALGRGARA